MTREEERLGAALDFYDKHTSAASNVTLVDSFVYGAKWADKTTIDKACAWLKDTMCYLDCGDYDRLTHYADTVEEMIDDFRKVMEE